jgi:hypothetical protein
MSITVTWNSAYEDDPAADDNVSSGDDEIRELKTAVREGLERELTWSTTDTSANRGLFRSGAGRAYYQSSEPTNRPDEATALNANDAGRIWVDSDLDLAYVWNGSAFGGWVSRSIADIQHTKQLRMERKIIPNWDMDAVGSWSTVLSEPSSPVAVISVDVTIRSDSLELHSFEDAGEWTYQLTGSTAGAIIRLERTFGGKFDDTDFDDITDSGFSVNSTSGIYRGDIVVVYIA